MIQYFKKLLPTIEDAVLSVDEERFEVLVQESIKALQSGHKVIVSGLGKNVPVCEKFAGTMNSLGQEAYYLNTNSAAHGDIGVVNEGDVVIVLTKSGRTSESVYLVDLLLRRGANTWLLTFTHDSPIEEMIGSEKCIILDLDHEGDKWDIVPNNSTTVNLIILQGLAMTIVDRMNVTLTDFKKNHPGGYIGERLKNV